MARNHAWQADLIGDHMAGRITDDEFHAISDFGTGRLSRRPRLARHRCGAWTLTGLDREVAALTVHVDPYALTPAGEVAALRDQRHTYRLYRGALDIRDQWNIPGHPPTHDLPVLAEHRCGAPVPDGWRLPPAPPAPPAPRKADF